LQLLSDCHRRIEHFLGVLTRVGESVNGILSQEQADALTVSLRYFREAAPKHVADEEESLFPRLREAGAAEALEGLDRLESDHDQADQLHRTAERIGNEWLEGRVNDSEVAEFKLTISELVSLYTSHIALEDLVIFPAAERLLTSAAKAMIGTEIATRREG